jgi:hypothetical protein
MMSEPTTKISKHDGKFTVQIIENGTLIERDFAFADHAEAYAAGQRARQQAEAATRKNAAQKHAELALHPDAEFFAAYSDYLDASRKSVPLKR